MESQEAGGTCHACMRTRVKLPEPIEKFSECGRRLVLPHSEGRDTATMEQVGLLGCVDLQARDSIERHCVDEKGRK